MFIKDHSYCMTSNKLSIFKLLFIQLNSHEECHLMTSVVQ